MRIRLRLYADFAGKMPAALDAEGAAPLELPEGARVADVLDRFQIPRAEAYVILLDGRHAAPETPLPEGAELAIFPAIVGG
ncbi:MAG: MoaD/ThiS family protein [Nitrospinota bacterium]